MNEAVFTWMQRLPIAWLRVQAFARWKMLHHGCRFRLRPDLVIHLREAVRSLEISIALQTSRCLRAVPCGSCLLSLFLDMPWHLRQ
jgi:hypothetical protein